MGAQDVCEKVAWLNAVLMRSSAHSQVVQCRLGRRNGVAIGKVQLCWAHGGGPTGSVHDWLYRFTDQLSSRHGGRERIVLEQLSLVYSSFSSSRFISIILQFACSV